MERGGSKHPASVDEKSRKRTVPAQPAPNYVDVPPFFCRGSESQCGAQAVWCWSNHLIVLADDAGSHFCSRTRV